jgi:hypothetical protein
MLEGFQWAITVFNPQELANECGYVAVVLESA